MARHVKSALEIKGVVRVFEGGGAHGGEVKDEVFVGLADIEVKDEDSEDGRRDRRIRVAIRVGRPVKEIR